MGIMTRSFLSRRIFRFKEIFFKNKEETKIFFTSEVEEEGQQVRVRLYIKRKGETNLHKGIVITRENFNSLFKALETNKGE